MADLAPLTLTPLKSITVGQTVHFQSTVTNQGAGPVNADIRDRVTLSTTPFTNGAIAQVEFDNGVNIGGNSSYTSFDPYGDFEIMVPGSLAPGNNYYLIYEVDIDNVVAESNETNNTLVQQVQVAIPDLVPLKLTQEQLLTAGQTIYFQILATNRGAGIINDTITERVTLSTTPSTNGAIIHVDFNDNVTLGGYSSYTSFDPYGDFKILVPGNLPPGTNYYFIYEVDVNNQVTESNETNNTLVEAAQLSIPDLAPLTLTPLGPLTEGLPVYFRSTVTNQGVGFIDGTVIDRVTLSTTPSTNGAIARVDFGNSININGNSSYTSFDPNGQFSLIVPPNLPPGTNYYLIYEVNVGSPQVTESNTNNNTLVVGTSVGIADLVAVSLTTNNQPIAGFPLSVSYTITNSGSTLAGTWDDQLTLSTLPTINGAITSWPLNNSHSLPYGSNYSTTRTIVLPQVATNTYYLILQTDAENVIPESNESNNVIIEKISVIEQPATISLLTPTNQVARETCVPVLYRFSAATQTGSYTITNITFFDGSEVIGQTTNVSDTTLSAVLDVGIHNINVKATDIFTNQVTSTNLTVLNLYYPTNLNVLRADLDLNTNFVGCMCALTGGNYAVLTTTNLEGFQSWQTNIILTNLATNMLFFTNKPTAPERYYRAQLQH